MLNEKITVLDHYYVELNNGCLGVVVGNTHFTGFIIGYIKYCPTNKETIWKKENVYYERIVKIYSPQSVRVSTPTQTYIHCYDSYVPVIYNAEVSKIYDPVVRTRKIEYRVRDELEERVLGIIYFLLHSGVEDGIGVTGSILPGIHNPRHSDIDLVVYGWKNSMDVIEYIEENKSLFKPFRGERLKRWIESNSTATGLPGKSVLKLYRNWRRGIFDGVEYSIIYNDGIYRIGEECTAWKTIGSIVIEAHVGGGLEALNYPSIGRIEEWKHVEGMIPKSDVVEVVSFNALFTSFLYDGGRGLIKGLLQHDPLRDVYRVLVGGIESPGYIMPL